MGSLVKKISKRANRFNRALAALEKHLSEEQSKSGDLGLSRPFDLAATVEQDLIQAEKNKRKERNKRKSRNRALKDKK